MEVDDEANISIDPGRSYLQNRLPDSLILEIMTYFDLQTLFTVACVDRRFYRLSQDHRFWKRLDLCGVFGPLYLDSLRRIIRRPSAVHVVSLRFEGFVRRFPSAGTSASRVASLRARDGFTTTTTRRGTTTTTNSLLRRRASSAASLTVAFLAELADRCPKLRELHIVYAELSTVTLRDFPPGLEFIGFEGCLVPIDYFGPLNDPNVLHRLNGLDLSYCHNVASTSAYTMPGILSRRQSLTSLSLRHCFKVSPEHLTQIPILLANLQKLSVNELTIVDGDFIRVLSSHARFLRELDISFCYTIDTAAFRPLVSATSVCRGTLRKLYAIETKLDDEALGLLAEHQAELTYLNVVKTGCTDDGIRKYCDRRTACKVEHKHSQVGAGKIGYSWWWIENTTSTNADADAGDGNHNMEH